MVVDIIYHQWWSHYISSDVSGNWVYFVPKAASGLLVSRVKKTLGQHFVRNSLLPREGQTHCAWVRSSNNPIPIMAALLHVMNEDAYNWVINNYADDDGSVFCTGDELVDRMIKFGHLDLAKGYCIQNHIDHPCLGDL
jgi:hypothetical protein